MRVAEAGLRGLFRKTQAGGHMLASLPAWDSAILAPLKRRAARPVNALKE